MSPGEPARRRLGNNLPEALDLFNSPGEVQLHKDDNFLGVATLVATVSGCRGGGFKNGRKEVE